MLLSQIIEDILAESGQFISGFEIGCVGINKAFFYRSIIQAELLLYERYRPLTFRFNRVAEFSHIGTGAMTFFSNADSTGTHDGSFDAGTVIDQRVPIFNRDPGMVPKWVSSVIPTLLTSTAGILYLLQETQARHLGERQTLQEPRTYLWHYERDDDHGVLYTSERGGIDITAHYDYPVIEMYDSTGELVDVEFKYMDRGKDDIFMDMILAKFLIMVGRSRRAFSLNNTPVNFDAQELVSEGQDLYAKAKQELYEQSNWYDALGR